MIRIITTEEERASLCPARKFEQISGELGKCKYEISCIEHSVKPLVGVDGYRRRIAISRRGGQYLREFEVFGTAADVAVNVIRG